jgi:hypothetical protein
MCFRERIRDTEAVAQRVARCRSVVKPEGGSDIEASGLTILAFTGEGPGTGIGGAHEIMPGPSATCNGMSGCIRAPIAGVLVGPSGARIAEVTSRAPVESHECGKTTEDTPQGWLILPPQGQQACQCSNRAAARFEKCHLHHQWGRPRVMTEMAGVDRTLERIHSVLRRAGKQGVHGRAEEHVVEEPKECLRRRLAAESAEAVPGRAGARPTRFGRNRLCSGSRRDLRNGLGRARGRGCAPDRRRAGRRACRRRTPQ